MAGRSPQSHAKRAREVALREKRERKREKKQEAAAARKAEEAGESVPVDETEPDTTSDDVEP